MALTSDQEVEALRVAIDAHCTKHKGKYLDSCIVASALLLAWFGYLRSSVSRHVADRLLDAAQATAIEAACCISVALVRPAIFSIRAQLELTLAWIYYNDHPVEWQLFEKTGRDYPMRAALIRYMHTTGPRFDDRLKLLQKTKTRKDDDPYSLLSVHVHTISGKGGPTIASLVSAVRSDKTCDECVILQAHVAEYLTDVLSAWYADHWHDFPAAIKTHVQSRLTPKDLKAFCLP
jgi:hypothetical protein